MPRPVKATSSISRRAGPWPTVARVSVVRFTLPTGSVSSVRPPTVRRSMFS